jgi:glycosyltransferase involved in cell wall biosynthesis
MSPDPSAVNTPLALDGKRICILTGVHLCNNPRVMKEASTLSRIGCDVTILGAYLDRELKERDLQLLGQENYRLIPVVDWTTDGAKRIFSRAISKAGKLLYRTLRTESPWQLGGIYPFLKRAAFRTPADLYICHMEQALGVGVALHRAGKRVAVDMEDWHSEDLAPRERRDRPVALLSRLEKYLLSKGEVSLCTSLSMAGSLAATYQCKRPYVVYNTFPWSDRNCLDDQDKDRVSKNRPSLYWFSQTIGPGRGLEDLMNALPMVMRELEIHIRGNPSPGYKEWLEAVIPKNWKGRVFFHDLVHNDEILSRIAEHDIGFAGEQPESRSRNVTISNKIFHYMLGGLAIVASDTAGQREIAAETDDAIRLYRAGDPQSLAHELNRLLASPETLKVAQAASLAAAQARYNWEVDEVKLQNILTEVLFPTVGGQD